MFYRSIKAFKAASRLASATPPPAHGPDGTVSLNLTPMSAHANSTQGSSTPSEKRGRGRPRGSGRKQ
ncbi:hypothetical protein QL285_029114 [Trifolium repens]|nr:hypothetical protein QL285_029114 [Trifolium repens]